MDFSFHLVQGEVQEIFLRLQSRYLKRLARNRAIVCGDEIHAREGAWAGAAIENARLPKAEGVFVGHAGGSEERRMKGSESALSHPAS